MRKLLSSSLMIWMISTVGAALAAPIPTIDVPALAAAADVIAIGSAGAVRAENRRETVSLTLGHVLKGDLGRAAPMVHLDLTAPAARPLASGQMGIFFLKSRGTAGQYSPVDPAHPLLVIAPSVGAPVASNPVLVSIARALAATLAAPFGSTNQALAVASRELYYDTAVALQTIPLALVEPELARILPGASPLTRLWAVGTLAAMGDVERLPTIEAILSNPPAQLSGSVEIVVGGLEGRVTSPSTVPTFAAVLVSDNTVVRRAAASILRDIGTEAAAKALTAVLDDRDTEVRYFAASGVARFAGGTVPAFSTFLQSEDQYLTTWRRWAETHSP